MTEKEQFDVKSVIEMLDGLPLSEDLRSSLELIRDALKVGMPFNLIALSLAGVFALKVLKTLQTGVQGIKDLQLEVELERRAIEGLRDAVYNHTSEAYHTVR